MNAGVGDHATCALARWTGASDAEETLLVANLSTSRACAATHGSLARCSAVATTLLAHLVTAHINLRFSAKYSLLKIEIDILAQVRTALGTAALATPASEHLPDAEEVPENVAEILECRGIKPSSGSCTSNSGVPVPVVESTLLAVSQNRIGFAALLELLFRIRIVGIAVGVELQSELAIGALELLIRSAASDAQDFVVITFYVASQNKPSPIVLLVAGVPRNLDHGWPQ